MAILKHIASKNANYGSAIDYLKYQHDEFHLVPVLDESGNIVDDSAIFLLTDRNLFLPALSVLIMTATGFSAFLQKMRGTKNGTTLIGQQMIL